MARILSVSYDPVLLETRKALLESKGYAVASARQLSEVVDYCNSGTQFDLFILGHSIPDSDKETLIRVSRVKHRAPVIALKRGGEAPVRGADFVVDPNPGVLLDSVAALVAGKSTAAEAGGG